MWRLAVLVVLFVHLQEAANKVNALPSHIQPLSYNLTISTHLHGGPSQNRYVGMVSIRLLVRQETRVVILHYRDISVLPEHTMVVRKVSGLRLGIESTNLIKETDEFVIKFRNRLWMGEEYTLSMVFSGNMAKPQRTGYYASFYKDNNTRKLYSLARFESEFARTAFPCFDEPKFRSNFTLYMAHSSDYLPLSNMPASTILKHPTLDGYLLTKFEESPPLATHMFTWALHQLEALADTVADDGTNLTIWGRPQNNTDERDAMLNEVIKFSKLLLMKSLHFFGFPLPLGNTTKRKIDHIVLPQHPKTIYKRGLLVYSENMLRQGTGQKLNLKEMVARYFVHQWNGILVSVSAWTESWIFNGLTAYVSIQLVNQLIPFSEYNQTRLLDLSLWVKQEDSMAHAKAAMDLPNDEQQESLRVNKLCLLFNMMSSFIGLHVLEAGLRNFWQKYANTTANGTQLWTELQNSARRAHVLPKGVDVSQVMKSWLDQPGYPLVVVHRNYEENSVFITQQRYSGVTWPNKPCWWIPITYMSQSHHTSHQEWLSCDKDAPELASITLKNVGQPEEWLLINMNGSNLQRTLYDLTNWSILNKILHTDTNQIPPINRAHLVDDALNLAWLGMLPYSVALGIVGYLPKETNDFVWQVAVYNLDKLHTIMFTTTGYRIFRTYMRTIFEDHFNSILSYLDNMPKRRTEKLDKDDEKVPLTRPHAFTSVIYHLACHFEVAACVTDATTRFKDSILIPDNEIPDGLRETVYCMAVRHGMEADWVLLRNKYLVTKTISERRIILKGMACSVDLWALEKLLKWCFDRRKVSKLLTVDLLNAIAKNVLGFSLVKKYLKEHIDEIKRMYDNDSILEILRPYVNEISTTEDLDELKELINNNLQRISSYSIKTFLEVAVAKVDWRQYRYFDLLKAIRKVMTVEDD